MSVHNTTTKSILCLLEAYRRGAETKCLCITPPPNPPFFLLEACRRGTSTKCLCTTQPTTTAPSTPNTKVTITQNREHQHEHQTPNTIATPNPKHHTPTPPVPTTTKHQIHQHKTTKHHQTPRGPLINLINTAVPLSCRGSIAGRGPLSLLAISILLVSDAP